MKFNYEKFNKMINMNLTENELLLVRYSVKHEIESLNELEEKYKHNSTYLLNEYQKLLDKVESYLKFIDKKWVLIMVSKLINIVYGTLSITLMNLVLFKIYNFAYIVSIVLLVTLFIAIVYIIAEFDD